MTNKKEQVNTTEALKEIKGNQDLVDFVGSLTKEEIQRIRDTREFDEVKPGTPTYKIAVLCDSLRQSMRRTLFTIDKRVWSIDDLQNSIRRLEIQLVTHNITETMKNGIVMNESELKSLIQHNKWLKDGEFFALYQLLAELRGVVGHKDVARNVIMTIEQFDAYVLELSEKLKAYGYSLFGELK